MALAENTFLNLHNSSDDTQPHSIILLLLIKYLYMGQVLSLHSAKTMHAQSMHFVRNEFRNSLEPQFK